MIPSQHRCEQCIIMKKLTLLIVAVSGLLQAQDTDSLPNGAAAVTPVPFNRIVSASQTEPQNWLTYSGSYSSQRFSNLTQITPENAKDLTLKWVFQARSLEKHEVTPLVVDGVMYTVQGINDVVALNAVTGKPIWIHSYKPSPETHNCCGQLTRGLAILGDKIFLAGLDTRLIALDAKTGKEVWNVQVSDPKRSMPSPTHPWRSKTKSLRVLLAGNTASVAMSLHSMPTQEKNCGASIQYLDPMNLATRLGRATHGNTEVRQSG